MAVECTASTLNPSSADTAAPEAAIVTAASGAGLAPAVRWPVTWWRWPTMSPDRVGYGAGHRDLADRPNLLRMVLGKPTLTEVEAGPSTHVLLEANVDDMTGELAAHALTTVSYTHLTLPTNREV